MILPHLYHWSPERRRAGITRRGLVPRAPAVCWDEEFKDDSVCLGSNPAEAWALSGLIVAEAGESWDLWQVYLSGADEVHFLSAYGPRVVEVRVFNRIPKSRIWHIGSRTPSRPAGGAHRHSAAPTCGPSIRSLTGHPIVHAATETSTVRHRPSQRKRADHEPQEDTGPGRLHGHGAGRRRSPGHVRRHPRRVRCRSGRVRRRRRDRRCDRRTQPVPDREHTRRREGRRRVEAHKYAEDDSQEDRAQGGEAGGKSRPVRRDGTVWYDLGDGVEYFRYSWGPDRELNPHYADLPDVEWAGIAVFFPDGCGGAVNFDLPVMRQVEEVRRQRMGGEFKPDNFWTVESWDPLTISPSVLCHGLDAPGPGDAPAPRLHPRRPMGSRLMGTKQRAKHTHDLPVKTDPSQFGGGRMKGTLLQAEVEQLMCAVAGCGRMGFAAWQACCDGRVRRPICAVHDVECNRLHLLWTGDPDAEEKILAYARGVEEQLDRPLELDWLH